MGDARYLQGSSVQGGACPDTSRAVCSYLIRRVIELC
jgi:hypothetical protein